MLTIIFITDSCAQIPIAKQKEWEACVQEYLKSLFAGYPPDSYEIKNYAFTQTAIDSLKKNPANVIVLDMECNPQHLFEIIKVSGEAIILLLEKSLNQQNLQFFKVKKHTAKTPLDFLLTCELSKKI